MKLSLRIILALVFAFSLALVAMPQGASAHPMGNFTVNQYSALTVAGGSAGNGGQWRVDILYVVDMAEIPTFSELQAIGADATAKLTDAQRDAYVATRSAELAGGLSLLVDGKPAPLTVEKAAVTFPEGAGGLPTLRFEMSLTAPLGSAARGEVAYRDNNFSERLGWKEVVVKAGSGASIQNSDAPATDKSNALRNYSPDLMSSPPTVTSASFSFAPGSLVEGGVASEAAPLTAASDPLVWAQSRKDALTDLLSQKEMSLGFFLGALLIAFGYGAGHALSPGHGKTLVAAYLVGSRGTPRHALLLGLTVTISHTVGVFVLGLVLLLAIDKTGTALYQWLPFLSGLAVAAMGVSLFVQRQRVWKRAKATEPHAHTHDGHEHDHDHSDDHAHDHPHDHDHPHVHPHPIQNPKSKIQNHDDPSRPHKHGLFGKEHTHLPADGQAVTMGNLLTLGIAGGLIPCPSALLMLFAAVAFQKIAFGLVLILSFSLGLASVLTGIGLLFVVGHGVTSRINFNNGLLARLPMVSAVMVTFGGLFLAYSALTTSLVP